jgi:hypothetical protein
MPVSRLSDTDIPVCADQAESLDHMGVASATKNVPGCRDFEMRSEMKRI